MKGIHIVLAAVLSYSSMASVVADEGTGAVDFHAVEATVGQILEQDHYTQRKLDSNMAKQILETYLESLDYDKLFFTQEDIDQIKNEYSSGLDDDILLGNLTSAKNIYEIFKQRVDQRVAKINELLTQRYNFSSNRTVTRIAPRSLERLPSADKVNNTVSVSLVLDVKRYFKPLWKPGHLLDNKLKSGSYCFLLAQRSKSHAAAVKIAPFAECNHLFSKGTDRLRLCQGRLDSTLLDEAANLVCQQQFSMPGFPAQFDRIFRVTHNSLKRHQLDVLAPFAAHRRVRPTLIRISFQDSDPAVAVYP